MTPEAVLKKARAGELLPVYLVSGEERFLRDQMVAELRSLCLAGGLADFNEDRFTAGDVDVDKVLGAARTVPMMAKRRFVLVRSVERWETAAGDDDAPSEAAGAKSKLTATPLDKLAHYAADPVPTTCVVLVAAKLDGRRKLTATAKKQGFLVSCDPLGQRELAAWIVARASERGNAIGAEVADFLAEIAGPELAYVSDAVERLALYVGVGQPITEAAVSECVVRVRTADTWALVDAVSKRDLATSLKILAEVYDPRDRGLPLLGALAWSIRGLAKFQVASAAGASVDEAARRAGQPYKARELASKVKAFRPRELERWLLVLAETDISLKSSRRPADAILEDMLTRLCRRAA